MRFEDQIMEFIDQQDWLEELGNTIQAQVRNVFEAGGRTGIKLRDYLHGTWLGHPLHPVVTDVPIGAWTAAATLDVLEMASGRSSFGKGADTAITVGIVGATAAAITGITDYQHVGGHARRVGLVHALLNSTALLFYISSLLNRKQGNRRAGWATALFGFAISSAAAYFGGHLVFAEKIGVNHAPKLGLPKGFTPVIAVTDLPEGKLHRVDVNNVPILLVRRGERIYALAERCAHLGGPLAEGELEDDDSVVCPWHGSRFSLEDGSLLQGPSTYEQPCLEARVRSGQVEVRLGNV